MSLHKKPTRHYSKRQETKVSKKLNGKLTSNSGATKFDKGDVKTDIALIECKTAVKSKLQMTVKKEWLESIRQEQFQMRKESSAVVFDFGDEGRQYAIITLDEYEHYLELLREELQNENF